MAVKSTQEFKIGNQWIPFSAWDATEEEEREVDHAEKNPLLLAFICNHCPYVKHLLEHFCKSVVQWQSAGLQVYAISCNDIDQYPEDAPEKMAELAREYGFTFPYLYDASQEVARQFDAQCTPEFYLFDRGGKLFYHGQYDDSRPSTKYEAGEKAQSLTGRDLWSATEDCLNGKEPPSNQKPSIGCSIKWK